MKKILLWSAIMAAVALTGIPAEGAGQQGTGSQRQGQTESAMDDMLGKDVQNEQGQVLGQVVALSIKSGEITYILVSKDGNEQELAVIPYAAAHFDPRKNAVVLSDVDDSRLTRAPSLTPDELQKLEDPEFKNRVRSYYGRGGGEEESSEKGPPMESQPGTRNYRRMQINDV